MTEPPLARTPHYTAGDVPALRRDLADWYGGPQGVQYYANAIALGQQEIRPPGPAERVSAQLAAAETARLRDGDLWYVDEDLCALLGAAHATMPAFAPRASDLPSKVGFAVFAEPIAVYPAQETRRDDVVDALANIRGGDEFRQMSDRLYSDEAQIVAVSWGPTSNPHWPAGGLWMSFYAASAVHFADLFPGNPAAAARARGMLPKLTVDNEAAIAWRPDGTPPEKFMLTGAQSQHGTLNWTRLVFAAFQLAAQANLAETDQQKTPRPERRRTEHAGLPARDVRVIRLRRSIAADRDTEQCGGREWRHRWVVRGHWRNHWYPSLGDHRPKWIAPYLKGPADAPLLGGDKVNVVTAAPPQQPSDPGDVR